MNFSTPIMDETTHHRLTQTIMHQLLEEYDTDYEVDLTAQGLQIERQDGKIWLISPHSASRQLWLASPISGGLHFHWNEADKAWRLSGGECLTELLHKEISL